MSFLSPPMAFIGCKPQDLRARLGYKPTALTSKPRLLPNFQRAIYIVCHVKCLSTLLINYCYVDSIWTVDLAYILSRYNIKSTLYTIHLNVQDDYASIVSDFYYVPFLFTMFVSVFQDILLKFFLKLHDSNWKNINCNKQLLLAVQNCYW